MGTPSGHRWGFENQAGTYYQGNELPEWMSGSPIPLNPQGYLVCRRSNVDRSKGNLPRNLPTVGRGR